MQSQSTESRGSFYSEATKSRQIPETAAIRSPAAALSVIVISNDRNNVIIINGSRNIAALFNSSHTRSATRNAGACVRRAVVARQV
jgi:predicted HAD superfamily hydrolase